MPAYIERTFRIKIGGQVMIVNMEEADDLMEGLRQLRTEDFDAISDKTVEVDDDESDMSLRKVQSKVASKPVPKNANNTQ